MPGQNTSHAVMAQRSEARDSLDDFPTPPWATRALLEHVIAEGDLRACSVLEPACGAGHMAKVLSEYFGKVSACDIYPYGYGDVADFLNQKNLKTEKFDWIITNPPFRLAEDFFFKSISMAKTGVALLTRTVFIESVGRYDRIFSKSPPTSVAQFAERVPMVKGRLDKTASTATGYCWLVWDKRVEANSKLVWIPPCRKNLERVGDYDQPAKLPANYVAIRTQRDLFT
jgi:SAM-dependent methyltransferase